MTGSTRNLGAGTVLATLERSGLTIAVAESLTGGLLAAELVAVPGASRVFRGGVVAYATDVKHSLLGVDEALLAERGPVDGDVAAQMARGVCVRLGADVGVATTGVAGPDPQGGRAAGAVFVAVHRAGHDTRVEEYLLVGDRSDVRRGSVQAALGLVAEMLR